MNSLIRPALYEAWHEIVNLRRLGEKADAVCEVVGPICESGDVLGRRRRLPLPREGDVLLIAQTGAYGSVMAVELQPARARAGGRAVSAFDRARGAHLPLRALRLRSCHRHGGTGVRLRRSARVRRAHRLSGRAVPLPPAREAAFAQALRLLHLIAGVSYLQGRGAAVDRGRGRPAGRCHRDPVRAGLRAWARRVRLAEPDRAARAHRVSARRARAGRARVAGTAAVEPGADRRRQGLAGVGRSCCAPRASRPPRSGSAIPPLIRACAERTGLAMLNLRRACRRRCSRSTGAAR